MTPLCFFDGLFDLPEDLSAADADGRANGSDRHGGVEGEDVCEVFRLEVAVCRFTAAQHEGVGGADCGCTTECCSYLTIIIRLDQCAVKFGENFFLVFVPIVTGKHCADDFQLVGQRDVKGDSVFLCQHQVDSRFIGSCYLPGNNLFGVGAFSCVGNIEYIMNIGFVVADVQQRDALGATADVAVHAVVPDIIGSAGRCFRTLCMDQQLIMVGVLVHTRCGGKVGSPCLLRGCNFLGLVLRKQGIGKGFVSHLCLRWVEIRNQGVQQLKILFVRHVL